MALIVMLRAQQVLNPAKKAPAIRAGATDKSFPVIVQYGD